MDYKKDSIADDEVWNIEVPKDEIIQEIKSLTDKIESNKVVVTKTANERISEALKRPEPNMLFDEFWFENELCILFADTNVGKSILAVQIADSITKGYNINRNFTMGAVPQKVIYFDAELSDKQFQLRYTDRITKQVYRFDDKFFTQELENPTGDTGDEVLQAIFEDVVQYGAKIIIIDNLSYIDEDNEKAKKAIPLLKKLKALKKKYGFSILVLSHTTKRDESKEITKNDLAGSKMLMNLCDSAFSIGRSNQSNKEHEYRYIKQIKVRNAEHKYSTDNVCLFQIVRESLLLQFKFESYVDEREHLKVLTEQDKEKRDLRILELKEQGLSTREIGADDQVLCSPMTVSRVLNKYNAV